MEKSCVCGYAYESKWDRKNNGLKVLKGTEPFISVNVVATINTDARWGTQDSVASIVACPECGTMKVEL